MSKKISKTVSDGKTFVNKRYIKTQLSAMELVSKKEENHGKSMTVPGQTMTVLEMVARHRAGLPIDGGVKTPLYTGEELLPNLDDMDLIDRAAYVEAVADRLADLKAKIANEAKSSEEKKFIDEVDKRVRERLKGMRDELDKNKITDVTEE